MLTSQNMKHLTRCIALDCEMVGVGSHGCKNMLARVSIVNSHGNVLYDSFVAPQEKVVDYRTSVSGVKPKDLINGKSLQLLSLLLIKCDPTYSKNESEDFMVLY